MIKKIVITAAGYLESWDIGHRKIEDAINDLNKLKKDGITHVELSSNYDVPVLNTYIHREETDEEYRKRIDEENRDYEWKRTRDLALLAELKAKYPDS